MGEIRSKRCEGRELTTDQLAGGNHIRSVVRNELRPVGDRLTNHSQQLASVQAQLTSTEQQLAKLISMVEKMGPPSD